MYFTFVDGNIFSFGHHIEMSLFMKARYIVGNNRIQETSNYCPSFPHASTYSAEMKLQMLMPLVYYLYTYIYIDIYITYINDFAHIPWEDTPNFPKPPQRKKFLHKLLVKILGYLPGVCG